MEKMILGRTGLEVTRCAFGCIPIQRIDDEASTRLLRSAFNGGINFYDTARAYTTSEHKLALAFVGMRDKVIIATKTGARTGEELMSQLETSLKNLNTDYIDLYQLHNPGKLPRPGESDGLYDALVAAKASGKVRHIGITNHKLATAIEAAQSGLYETVQFPMSSLASDEELELVKICGEQNVGFIAMKALAGGLITKAASTFAFLRTLENVVPIWGIEHLWQLEEFLTYSETPPALDEKMWAVIEKDRAELRGGFCRSCGYCLPCPAEIAIPQAARMRLLLGRTSYKSLISENNQAMMKRINDCIDCGHCKAHCPYGLDTPKLLKENLEYFEQFVTDHANEI